VPQSPSPLLRLRRIERALAPRFEGALAPREERALIARVVVVLYHLAARSPLGRRAKLLRSAQMRLLAAQQILLPPFRPAAISFCLALLGSLPRRLAPAERRRVTHLLVRLRQRDRTLGAKLRRSLVRDLRTGRRRRTGLRLRHRDWLGLSRGRQRRLGLSRRR
jgi:hypothetical protein